MNDYNPWTVNVVLTTRSSAVTITEAHSVVFNDDGRLTIETHRPLTENERDEAAAAAKEEAARDRLRGFRAVADPSAPESCPARVVSFAPGEWSSVDVQAR